MGDGLHERVVRLWRSGSLEQAASSLRTHLKLKPKDAQALQLLAQTQLRMGDHAGGVVSLQRAAQAQPSSPELRCDLANALVSADRIPEAIQQWESVLQSHPDHEASLAALAACYPRVGRSLDGVRAGERAVALRPDWPGASANLALALSAAGRTEDAQQALADGVGRHPGESRLWSTWLFGMNFRLQPVERVLEAHRAFGARFADPAPCPPHDPDPERPLRVGVVSPDLGESSVSHFIGAFLAHRPAGGALVAFSTAQPRHGDPVAARLRTLFDEFVEAWHMDATALESAMRGRRLDVLIDLAGHVWNNALPVLATRPAPVIISAIGYANTTGVPAVDWRLVDSITDPPGHEGHCTEGLLRLDPCFLCFEPGVAPEPASPPDDQPFTFGSFNNAEKISPETIRLWTAVMQAVPGSRLLLKSQAMSEPAARRRLQERLHEAGMPPDRLEMVAYTAGRDAHLRLYARVHVSLDTTPYNGTTTTCEALWMGVPVITTLGDRHAARVSASLLAAAGHPEWVAQDHDDFVRIAVALASDRARLADLRVRLRSEIAASPLCDAPGYASRFHAAIRSCWSEACAAMHRG
ncbi:MAG: hypothetical protein RLZZ558_1013 [Planctomycetota bacterium]